MRNFVFNNPTRIIFGKDTINRIGNEMAQHGIKKVLMMYGKKSIFQTGVYEEVTGSLTEAGIEFVELGGIEPNPVLTKVKEAIELARQHQVEGILAVGGGSVIDSAKAAAVGVYHSGEVWEFFEGKARAQQALPIFTVLTISATASEMNQFAVITREDDHKKWGFGSALVYPRVSIIDPAVQASLSRRQTINGAIDAISHVFESYLDPTPDTDLMDEIAEGIIRTVMKHVQILLDNPADYESRAQLAWSATLALNGIVGTGRRGGDWASHDIEHSLSALYNVDHGQGLAVIMPAWMRFVFPHNLQKFARMAVNIFGINAGSDEEKALAAINHLRSFYQQIGAPVTLQELDIPASELETIARNASVNGPLGKVRKLHEEDILAILKLAYE